MKIKPSELTGAALDWAVEKARAAKPDVYLMGEMFKDNHACGMHNYSTSWEKGGPILQNHISELIDCGGEGWEACCDGTYGATGSTALIAVCRAYVASKLGDEVEVPDELA